MMNRVEHLLTILAEESCEVGQRCSKALRFGLTEVQPGHGADNAKRITHELNDLFAVAKMLQREGALPGFLDEFALARKQEKVERYMELSMHQGTLECVHSHWMQELGSRTRQCASCGMVEMVQLGECQVEMAIPARFVEDFRK